MRLTTDVPRTSKPHLPLGWRPAAVTLAGVILLLALPAPPNPDKPGRTGGLRTAAAQVRGEGLPVDLVQDYVGARELATGEDPYPILTQAFSSVGLDWSVPHRSTHPPTAFVLALPIAWMDWGTAGAVWAVAMIVVIAIAWWALGVSAAWALPLAFLALIWPPTAWSIGQLTPIWLVGLALAWRFRDRPGVGGAAIAVASLTKFMPAVMLLAFVALRRWTALVSFMVVWSIALGLVEILNHDALTRYVEVARSVGREQSNRRENSALVVAAEHKFGVPGAVLALILVAVVIVAGLLRVQRRRTIDRLSWDACNWAAVGLLPIAWIYSLLPVLPTVVRQIYKGGLPTKGLALVALVVPFFIDPFGLPGAAWLAVALTCVGIGLVISLSGGWRSETDG